MKKVVQKWMVVKTADRGRWDRPALCFTFLAIFSFLGFETFKQVSNYKENQIYILNSLKLKRDKTPHKKVTFSFSFGNFKLKGSSETPKSKNMQIYFVHFSRGKR